MDILELLKKHGIEVADDKIEALEKDLRTNFKSKHEVDNLREKINTLETELEGKQEELSKIDTETKEGIAEFQTKMKEYSDLKEEFGRLQESNLELALGNKALELGVDPDFSEFVISKAKSLVSDEVDAETALSNYLSENSQFIQTKTEPKGTSPSLTGENKPALSLNDALFNLSEGD